MPTDRRHNQFVDKIRQMTDQYRVADGNTSRSILNKFVADHWRQIWNTWVEQGQTSLMHKQAIQDIEAALVNAPNKTPSMKNTLRAWIDTVDRNVKLALLIESVDCLNHTSDGGRDNMKRCLHEIVQAISDPDKCHPKRRGISKAFGFPKHIPYDETILVGRLLQLTANIGDNRMSEVMYANTAIAIHNQRLLDEGHVVHSNEVVYPDEATVKQLMNDIPVEHELKDGERERIVDAVVASVQLMSLAPEWPSIDHLMSEASNPDNFNTLAIKSIVSDDATIEGHNDAPVTEPPASWSINESMKPAIDQLLASGGSSLTFDQMVKQHNDVVTENLKLVNAVSKPSSNVLPVGGDADGLTY